jgi:hypothetical protein
MSVGFCFAQPKKCVGFCFAQPNLLDFYVGWVEARDSFAEAFGYRVRVAQNPRNVLGFASLNPTY